MRDGALFEPRRRMRLADTNDGSLARLELKSGTRAITRVAAVIWAAGWLATEASMSAQAFRYGWTVGAIGFTALWTLFGGFALIAIVWAAVGKPEVVTVSGQSLRLHRGVGPFGRTQSFDGGAVRALRVSDAQGSFSSDYAAIRSFWDRGAGRIAFDVQGLTYAFGASLDDPTVNRILATIGTLLPAASVHPGDGEPDTPRSRRRRPGWAAHATSWVVIGGLLFPARTLITDLPICTGGALGGEYEPISPHLLYGEGRVVLAPFGNFPPDAAQRIADHFREKFAVPIAVASSIPLPGDAADPERNQLDSGVLLSALERAHPDSNSAVIGLTNEDMFIRELAWRYAFSNRRPPRLAVVSPFRMDRGCMGIRPASAETQLARLRKMVGKNIGVLFYHLPLSGHPRSMMYAAIGGPQELDTILDEF